MNDPESSGCGGFYKSTWGDVEVNSVCAAHCGSCAGAEELSKAELAKRYEAELRALCHPNLPFAGIARLVRQQDCLEQDPAWPQGGMAAWLHGCTAAWLQLLKGCRAAQKRRGIAILSEQASCGGVALVDSCVVGA